MLICVVFFSYSSAQKYYDVIDSFMVSKFIISNKTSVIDTAFLNFKKVKYPEFCIAEIRQNFIRTDVVEYPLCPSRIILYGQSTRNNLHVLLFEEFQGGRVGVSCEMFFSVRNGVSKYLYFYCNPKVRSLRGLKKWLRQVKEIAPMNDFR